MSGSVDNHSLRHPPQASAPPSPSSASSARSATSSSSAYATSSLEPKRSKVDDSPGGCASCFACFVQAIKNFIAWICSCCFGAPDKPEAGRLPQGSQEAAEQQAVAPPPALPLVPLNVPVKVPGILPMTALKSILEDKTQVLTEEQLQRVIDDLRQEALTPESFKELFELAAARALAAKIHPNIVKDGSIPLTTLMKNHALFRGKNPDKGSLTSYQLQVAIVESENANQLKAFIEGMDPSKRVFRIFKEAYPFAKHFIDIGKEMALDVLLKNRSLFPVYQTHPPQYSKREMDEFLRKELRDFIKDFPSGPSTKAQAALLIIIGKHAPEADKLLLFVIEKGIESRKEGSTLGRIGAAMRGENPADYREPYNLCMDVVKGLLEAPTTVINPQIAIDGKPLCFYLARLIESTILVSERRTNYRMEQTADYCRDLLCAVVASQKINVLAVDGLGIHAVSYLAVRCNKVSLDRIIALRPEVFDPLAFQELSSLIGPGQLTETGPSLGENEYFIAYRVTNGFSQTVGDIQTPPLNPHAPAGPQWYMARQRNEQQTRLKEFIASYVPAARAVLQQRNEALQTHFPNQENPLRDLVISYLTPAHMQLVPAAPQSAPRSTAP